MEVFQQDNDHKEREDNTCSEPPQTDILHEVSVGPALPTQPTTVSHIVTIDQETSTSETAVQQSQKVKTKKKKHLENYRHSEQYRRSWAVRNKKKRLNAKKTKQNVSIQIVEFQISPYHS